ncbi:hypothetical protein AXG93_857s1330 [Marchantia polymorpha subsp. ruderalis]|uniref:Large ribosomal subunit protein uL18c n=1 Tax=Marchantia polymorpha subsp. ruderalis TaxID=1480154 RepID=A0A176WCC2_MARPO|nr:hypothetical protein AXG93_857s1330 [Marchantia polymorpha subsp. ruderalis]
MASMAMVTGTMAALSLSSSSKLVASSCSSEFASVKSFSTASTAFGPFLSASRTVRLNEPLRIEAREPTRRETIKLNGTTERPRLAVFRSNKHLYAQVIDDTKQHTLASSSTLTKPMREELGITSGPTIDAAKRVGEEIAKVCLEKGITQVAFDRGGFVYTGRIQALAEAAREGGLVF